MCLKPNGSASVKPQFYKRLTVGDVVLEDSPTLGHPDVNKQKESSDKDSSDEEGDEDTAFLAHEKPRWSRTTLGKYVY